MEMIDLKIKTKWWLAVLFCLPLLSCVKVSVPDAPESTADTGSNDCSDIVCDCAGPEDRAYRFTELKATSPGNIAPDLNTMWETEISNYITNVILLVLDAEEGEDTDVVLTVEI